MHRFRSRPLHLIARRGSLASLLVLLPLLAQVSHAREFHVPEEVPEISGYQNWEVVNPFGLSGLHWNQVVRIFMNSNLQVYRNNHQQFLNTYMSDSFFNDEAGTTEKEGSTFQEYPPGTILVKENYMLGEAGGRGEPSTLTVMIKRKPGFDPGSGDWEFIQSAAEGKVLLRGGARKRAVNAACVQCHAHMQERDYIFSTQSTRPVP